jgi:predicted nucleotidyltransferase component of viral defense system
VLNKTELVNIASIRGIKPHQQEKHYLQTLILNILSEYPLVFKGGTYLWFFHGLDRFSIDLDFTIDLSISPYGFKDLKSFSNHISSRITNMLWILEGVKSNCKIINLNEFGFSLKISAEGPLYTTKESLCFVDVDISYREEVLLPTTSFSLDFPFYNLPIKIIRCMSIEEIFIEKIRTIYTRRKGRDVYDLWFLINKKGIHLTKDLITMIDKKLNFKGTENPHKFSMVSFKNKLLELEEVFSKDMYEIKFQDINKFEFYYNEIIENIK